MACLLFDIQACHPLKACLTHISFDKDPIHGPSQFNAEKVAKSPSPSLKFLFQVHVQVLICVSTHTLNNRLQICATQQLSLTYKLQTVFVIYANHNFELELTFISNS